MTWRDTLRLALIVVLLLVLLSLAVTAQPPAESSLGTCPPPTPIGMGGGGAGCRCGLVITSGRLLVESDGHVKVGRLWIGLWPGTPAWHHAQRLDGQVVEVVIRAE